MTPARIRGRPFCIRGSYGRKTCFSGQRLPQERFVADAALFAFFEQDGRLLFERQYSERLNTHDGRKITSRENAKIKYACRLSSSAAFRRSEGRFLAEGRKLCPELPAVRSWRPYFIRKALWQSARSLPGCPANTTVVEDHVADKLADVGTHQGVFGRVPYPGAPHWTK